MLSKKTQDLINLGERLFANKAGFDSFLDSIALSFYPERVYVANSYSNSNGSFYGSNLASSYPILMRRTLGEVFSNTRPKYEQWFEIVTNDYEDLGNDARAWLDNAGKLQKSFIYDVNAGFEKATTQADQDFATFGQAVVSIEPNWNKSALVHRCWKIRDAAWQEDYAGNINQVYRRCAMRRMDVYHMFGDKCSPQLIKDLKTDPFVLVPIFHIVMTKEDYEDSFKDDGDTKFKIDKPFVSIYVDVTNQHRMEIVPIPTLRYVIPRWATFSGSQYALSTAIMTAIPDAALLQAMTLTLLDAGEKAASPPILAREDAVRGDIGLSANAVTVINGNYDGAVDDAIKMMQIDRSGMQFALTLVEQTREAIKEAFYINRINLRQPNEKMTAFEVNQIVKENARSLLALFSPVDNFNAKLCETQFFEFLHAGLFGDPKDIPDELKGADVSFKFKNALLEAQNENKMQLFTQIQGTIANTLALDPSVANIIDIKKATRDMLYSASTPPKWLRSEEQVAAIDQQQQQTQQASQLIQQLNAGGQAAESVGKGAQAVQQAGLV